MRLHHATNIDIDDDLMDEALRRSGAPTIRAAVEEGLRLLIQTAARPAFAACAERSGGKAISTNHVPAA